jgi:hypothetical protein
MCSCGETKTHRVATRKTADGTTVYGWHHGEVTGLLGMALPSVPLARPKTPEAIDRALAAMWLFMGEVELCDVSDLGALYAACRKVAANGGLPGDVRRELHAPKTAALPPLAWQVTATDRDGKTTERQAMLPRLRWPGLAVIDYCGRTFSARGRYHLVTIERDKFGRGDLVATATGFQFNTLTALWAHLADS